MLSVTAEGQERGLGIRLRRAEEGLSAACLSQTVGARRLSGHLDGGFGVQGSESQGQRGAWKDRSSCPRQACLAKILFLVLSEGRGSRAGHRSPRSQWVAGALPALTQSLASVCLEAAYFQPFPPGQGSRAGHDLTQQLRPRCGHPVRPGHSVSNACSPEVALNHTAGLVLGWLSGNSSLLVVTVSAGKALGPGEVGVCHCSHTSGR